MALYGIYGRHEIDACPINNSKNRQMMVQIGKRDMKQICADHKINKIIGRYHSALEHTFLWIIDAEDPHLIQKLAMEGGVASFNEVKIVPLIEFENVVKMLEKMDN